MTTLGKTTPGEIDFRSYLVEVRTLQHDQRATVMQRPGVLKRDTTFVELFDFDAAGVACPPLSV